MKEKLQKEKKRKKEKKERETKNKNIRFTTPIQQLHNNPSHESGLHTLGPTLM
jgi:hypothetical protein